MVQPLVSRPKRGVRRIEEGSGYVGTRYSIEEPRADASCCVPEASERLNQGPVPIGSCSGSLVSDPTLCSIPISLNSPRHRVSLLGGI